MRLCCQSLATSAVAVGLLMPVTARSAEQCVPTAELSVPATSEGLYINLVTGLSGATEASVPGFDFDPYAAASTDPSGQLKFYWGPASNNGAGVASVGDTYAVLAGGQEIGPTSVFTRAAFTGNTNAWQAGVTGYLGTRFRIEPSNEIRYGWLKLTTTAPLGFPLTVHGWCYEDSGAAILTPTEGEAPIFRDSFEA